MPYVPTTYRRLTVRCYVKPQLHHFRVFVSHTEGCLQISAKFYRVLLGIGPCEDRGYHFGKPDSVPRFVIVVQPSTNSECLNEPQLLFVPCENAVNHPILMHRVNREDLIKQKMTIESYAEIMRGSVDTCKPVRMVRMFAFCGRQRSALCSVHRPWHTLCKNDN